MSAPRPHPLSYLGQLASGILSGVATAQPQASSHLEALPRGPAFYGGAWCYRGSLGNPHLPNPLAVIRSGLTLYS